MRNRIVFLLILSVGVTAVARATDISPTVKASIHDGGPPTDGVGDSFNATPFTGLIQKTSPQAEDRAIQEFDVSAYTTAALQTATLSGRVSVNNAFDVGVRTFDFLLYAGNGVADLSDFQIPAVVEKALRRMVELVRVDLG